jgi:hypothetical protein
LAGSPGSYNSGRASDGGYLTIYRLLAAVGGVLLVCFFLSSAQVEEGLSQEISPTGRPNMVFILDDDLAEEDVKHLPELREIMGGRDDLRQRLRHLLVVLPFAGLELAGPVPAQPPDTRQHTSDGGPRQVSRRGARPVHLRQMARQHRLPDGLHRQVPQPLREDRSGIRAAGMGRVVRRPGQAGGWPVQR